MMLDYFNLSCNFVLEFNFFCLLFISSFSEKIVTAEIPVEIEALAAEKRRELIETVSEVDDKLADAFLADESISTSDLEVYPKTKNVFLKEK